MIANFLLPAFCWFLLLLLFFHHTASSGPFTRLRIAALLATITHGLLVLIMTECLSAFALIKFSTVVTGWALIAVALLGVVMRKKIGKATLTELLSGLSGILKMGWMVWGILLLAVVSFILAVIYPPNNYDALTYHMGRVAHWIQNQSISHYPTHVTRQLIYQPFAEIEILHVQLLTGGDRLANTVQTIFYAGCIMNVSLIAKELGGNAKQQLLSSFFAALIPAVVLESNTTQNDIVVSYFVLAFVYFVLRLTKQTSLALVCWAGSAFGLALLTKGTAYLFSLPFAGWLILLLLKQFRLPFMTIVKKAALLAVVPLIALLINSTFFYRNIVLTGTPLGDANKGTGNEGMNIKSLIVVGAKDLMNHLPVSNSFKDAFTQRVTAWGVDINDTKYSLGHIDWMANGFSFHEDYMQNTIHVVLILLLTIVFFCRRSLYRKRIDLYTLFVLSLLASSLLYCIMLKWQPWSNRLQAPLFLLYCVFLSKELSRIGKWLSYVCAIVMFGFAAIALAYSERHPILPVSKSIARVPFNDFLYPPGMLDCQAFLKTHPVNKIGIYIARDDKDYLYYRLLAPSGDPSSPRIRHILVENESSIYPNGFVPDIIISMQGSREKYTLHGKEYVRKAMFDGGPVIFGPVGPIGPLKP